MIYNLIENFVGLYNLMNECAPQGNYFEGIILIGLIVYFYYYQNKF